MTGLTRWARRHAALALPIGLFVVLYGVYVDLHPNGFGANVTLTNANQAFALALVAMAQALPILSGGLDLSVGAVMVMSTCLASVVVNGSPVEVAFGLLLCLLAGLAAGLLNGVLVVYGRIQPIIVTLASSALFLGIAMFLRPTPGGEVDLDLSDAMTYGLAKLWPALDWPVIGRIPVSLTLLLLIVLLVWLPFRSSKLGRGVYAVGSAENAAYLSGVPVAASRLAAYALAGVFAAMAGLFIGFLTGSGDAKAAQAGLYTLNSIAAVVIGGNSLAGGTGGLIGPIFGALVLRTIASLMRVTDTILWVIKADPLIQPLFEGLVLLIAVTLGASRALRVKNRLDWFR
jgi:ribose transport system permease protein